MTTITYAAIIALTPALVAAFILLAGVARYLYGSLHGPLTQRGRGAVTQAIDIANEQGPWSRWLFALGLGVEEETNSRVSRL